VHFAGDAEPAREVVEVLRASGPTHFSLN
jgi:hypothetical protein